MLSWLFIFYLTQLYAFFPQTGTVGVLNSYYSGSMDKMIRVLTPADPQPLPCQHDLTPADPQRLPCPHDLTLADPQPLPCPHDLTPGSATPVST